MVTLSIRTLTENDLLPMRRMLAGAFLTDFDENQPERWESVIEWERTHGVFDGDQLIGTSAVLSKEITLPGGVQAPTTGITAVGVKPGHRRRGVLSLLMKTQLNAQDEALSVLWASEGSIYGRFGYGGVASDLLMLELPHGAPFHDQVSLGDERIEELPREEAMPAIQRIHDHVRRRRSGWLDRSQGAWLFHFADESHHRGGMSGLRFALHPGGYVVYRVRTGWDQRGPKDELHVVELVAETDEAHAALYRHLLDMDLAGDVKHHTAPDDPVVHLLANPRLAIKTRSDALWVRIADLERALPQRHYPSDVDTVLEVTDRVCPRNEGRWRFTAKGGEATVERTDTEPDVALDIAALGSAFLGGSRLSALARAQRVHERTPGAVATLSHAFLGEHEPHCPELF